jgi:hypothetical protein
MSELKKAQSNRKKQNFFFENLIFSNWLDASDQTSTDKILEEEDRILQNVVETKG